MLPHLDSAHNLARWLTHSDNEARDVVQEAFLRAYRFFDRFQGEHGRAWLLAIVRNAAYDWMSEGRASEATLAYDEARHEETRQDGPEVQFARGEERQRVNAALRRLAPEFREVLILREIEDLSYRDIAHIAAIPVGTVMSRLARARKEIAQLLANEAPHGP